MKSTTYFAVLFSILPGLHAHCTHSKVGTKIQTHNTTGVYPAVSVNGGAQSKHWQYVRKLGSPPLYSTPDNPERGHPHHDIYSEEIRCGRGAFASANTTETLVVNAGDEMTFFTYGSSRENNVSLLYDL